MAADPEEPWRIPTGLGAPPGLQPSPGIAPPAPSAWPGTAPVPPAAVPAAPVPAPPPSATPAAVPAPPAPAPGDPAPPAARSSAPFGPASGAGPNGGPAGRRKLLAGVGIGVLAVGLALGFATLQEGTAGLGVFGDDGTPEAAARHFFEALRDADPAAAIGFLADPEPGTREHLPLPPTEAPAGGVDDIEAHESWTDGDTATVDVDYTVGGEYVSTALSLARVDGEWRIAGGGTVRPQGPAFQGWPLTINGTPLSAPAPALLPGAYELGFETDTLGFADDERLMVLHLSDGKASEQVDAIPQLTPAGSTRFATALRSALQQCLDSAARTTECGMDVDTDSLPEGYEFVGVLSRTLNPDFDAVLDEYAPELERDTNGSTGYVVLPAEFDAEIRLQVSSVEDGTVRTGYLRDPEPSLRPRAGIFDSTMRIEWFSAD